MAFIRHIMLRDLFTQKCSQNILVSDLRYYPRVEDVDSENIKM
jgi:hypothetical protein